MDCSLPGSSIHGIFQAWILEWVAISSSRGSSWPRDWNLIFSGIVGWFFTLWAVGETLLFTDLCVNSCDADRFISKNQCKLAPPSAIALISHASKVMLKILQARLQQYVHCELPDVQAGFRKGRGTRDQIAIICWIIKKAREFQKNNYFCFIDYAKAFDCVDHNKLENSERDGNIRPPDLPLEKSVCRSGSSS